MATELWVRPPAGPARSCVRALLAFLLPDSCVSCGAPLPVDRSHVCIDCARTLIPRPSEVVLPVPPDLDRECARQMRARYCLEFGGATRALVHALKYSGRTSLAPALATLAEATARGLRPSPSVLVHVPLSPVKRRARGFDQSELVAARLAALLGIMHVPGLRRVRTNRAQAVSDRASRLTLGSDAFAPTGRPLRGPVLLVDDVVTTGATMAAAAHALARSVAAPIFCLAVAGTRSGGASDARVDASELRERPWTRQNAVRSPLAGESG